jgi:hypothetical protein
MHEQTYNSSRVTSCYAYLTSHVHLEPWILTDKVRKGILSIYLSIYLYYKRAKELKNTCYLTKSYPPYVLALRS